MTSYHSFEVILGLQPEARLWLFVMLDGLRAARDGSKFEWNWCTRKDDSVGSPFWICDSLEIKREVWTRCIKDVDRMPKTKTGVNLIKIVKGDQG